MMRRKKEGRGDGPTTLLDGNPHIKRERKEWEEAKRRHREGGAWVHQYEFTHYLHVSLPKHTGLKASRESVDRVFRHLRSHAKNGFAWFVVIEKGRVGGLYHFHALVYAPGMTVEDIRAPWADAMTQGEVYDRARGGAWYTIKEVAQGGGEDFLISDPPPPLFIPPTLQSTG